jgi:hypothetical protein
MYCLLIGVTLVTMGVKSKRSNKPCRESVSKNPASSKMKLGGSSRELPSQISVSELPTMQDAGFRRLTFSEMIHRANLGPSSMASIFG